MWHFSCCKQVKNILFCYIKGSIYTHCIEGLSQNRAHSALYITVIQKLLKIIVYDSWQYHHQKILFFHTLTYNYSSPDHCHTWCSLIFQCDSSYTYFSCFQFWIISSQLKDHTNEDQPRQGVCSVHAHWV